MILLSFLNNYRIPVKFMIHGLTLTGSTKNYYGYQFVSKLNIIDFINFFSIFYTT